MKKIIFTALWTLTLTAALSTGAFARELELGGQAVGIQAGTKGVLVAGLTQVETESGSLSPAESAGVKKGDLILAVNGQDIASAAGIVEAVGGQEGRPVELTLRREDKTMRMSVQPVRSAEGQWVLGMWLRDSISGIGTLTFCDPDSGIYGALGHGITDGETGTELPLSGGSITGAEIISVTPGQQGSPGELNGCADLGTVLGSIDGNTDHGIFGRLYSKLGGRIMETGEIAPGPASIISTVMGRETAEYQVEINRVYQDAEGRHVMLTVTDPRLQEKTGGIVQGMSGSPILQNGRLVGAVTHVFVNDPMKGYGVSITDMLRSAGIEEQAA